MRPGPRPTMLLFVLLLHNALADHSKKETTYTVKNVESCPDAGYYFENELSLGEMKPGLCHLCFCRRKGDAVCWERPISECLTKVHITIEKGETRSRRSPLSNVALKYMSKGISSKQSTYNCMPLGSTLSEGCPPDDWCLGCTICDCEASGHWNCHILSFCSDKKATKHLQTHNNTLKRRAVKIHPKADNLVNTTKVHKSARKLNVSHKCNSMTPWCNEYTLAKRNSNLPKHDDKVVVFEKDLAGRKPTEIQGVRVKKILNENNTNVRLAQKVQRAMAAVHKIISMNERNFTNTTKYLRVIKKRSMSHHEDKINYQTANSPQMYKKSSPRRFKKKVVLNKISDEMNGKKRVKRDARHQGNDTQILQSATDVHDNFTVDSSQNEVQKLKILDSKDHEYYKYNVVTDKRLDNKKDLKVKHMSYNFIFGNKTVNVHKTISHNLSDTNMRTRSDIFNLSMSHHSKDKKQNIKSINITDIKYLTIAPDMNKSMDYNELKIQKNNFEVIPVQRNVFKENVINTSNETEDLNLINNMLNSKGILQHVLKRKSKIVPKHRNDSDSLSFITNLKLLFNKIFFNGKNKKDRLKVLDKQNLFDTFCIKNVSCKVNPRDEIKLQMKINELNGEMYKIIETIKIIKKLLTQIFNHNEVDRTDTKQNFDNKEKTFSDAKSNNITDNQKLQLFYIKDGLKTFIKSIGKFSYILQDIIRIMTDKENVRRSPHRPLRCTRTNGLNKTRTLTAEQRFKKLKTALINYNLLQNTFIKRIYEMLTKLETNLTSADKKKKNKRPERAYNKDINKSEAVEKFTRNIVDNLRKLKNLALKLSSTTHRRKRSTMGDDDAIEYLLMLMEYLLKQNYPLDASPVNDGIDLLIDAIKHAPDIKPIKKKVLDYSTTTASVTRTSPPATEDTFTYTENDNQGDGSEREGNDTSRSDDNQVVPKTTDEGNNKIEDFQKLIHGTKKFKNSFRLSNFNSILKNAKLKPVTTTAPIITTTPIVQYDFLKYSLSGTAETEKYGKLSYTVSTDDKNELNDNYKYANENDRSQVENDDYPPNLSKAVPEPAVSFHVSVPTRTSPAETTTTRKFHHMVREKFENPNKLINKKKHAKSKFNWVDYDQSEDGGKKIERKTLTKSDKDFKELKKQILRAFNKNDVSAISKEIMEDDKNTYFDKLLPNAIFKKMESVNSLEYDATKPEVESESKDLEPEDTYVNDVFPSYFV
ncbi:uncharacterized protein [Battus philenor]|uniref:uncharacterized protein n=1 Tax=Battus philenor TaxID=42288 RepID=UPI0035CFC9F1